MTPDEMAVEGTVLNIEIKLVDTPPLDPDVPPDTMEVVYEDFPE